MPEMTFDGQIIYDKEDQTEKRRKFAESIRSNDLHCVDNRNAGNHPIQGEGFPAISKVFPDSQGLHRVTDEYGNVVSFDSEGNIDSIMVSPYKID